MRVTGPIDGTVGARSTWLDSGVHRVCSDVTASVTTDVRDLYARHYLPLVRLARQLVDDLDSAEDVVQDVFAALGDKPPRDPLPYLRRAVVNRSRSMLRRRRVSRAFASRAVRVELGEPADADALRTERRRALLARVTALPSRQREVVLRYYEELSVTEIAGVLGISAGAVSTALSRALDALGKTIERSNVDD